jgi:hypothetical protein
MDQRLWCTRPWPKPFQLPVRLWLLSLTLALTAAEHCSGPRSCVRGCETSWATHMLSLSELPGLRPFSASAVPAVHATGEQHAAQQDQPADDGFTALPADSAMAMPMAISDRGAPQSSMSARTTALSSRLTRASVDAPPSSTALHHAADVHVHDEHAAGAVAAATPHDSTAVDPASATAHSQQQPRPLTRPAAEAPSNPVAALATSPKTAAHPRYDPGNTDPASLATPAVKIGGRAAVSASDAAVGVTAQSSLLPGIADSGEAVAAEAKTGAHQPVPSPPPAAVACGTAASLGAMKADAPVQQPSPTQPAALLSETAAGSAADHDDLALQDVVSQLRMENAMLKVWRPVWVEHLAAKCWNALHMLDDAHLPIWHSALGP